MLIMNLVKIILYQLRLKKLTNCEKIWYFFIFLTLLILWSTDNNFHIFLLIIIVKIIIKVTYLYIGSLLVILFL